MSSSQTSSSSEAAQPAEALRAPHPLAAMMDVGCTVDVVVGDGTITVRDCLKLKRHSVVRLRRQAGSDLSISVQGVPVATGEVVVIDDRAAIRIARIASPSGGEGSE